MINIYKVRESQRDMSNQELEEKIDHFDRLPEGCIADTISYTTPVDACRLALVSPSFRLIADSDAVWERFLPSDYTQIISRADQLLPISPKKNLYLSLCDHPLTIDAGALTFSLDKSTGKKCFMIAAIVDEDHLSEVEIHGRISTSLLSPDTTYTIYLVYKPSTGIHSPELPQRADFVVGVDGETFTMYCNVLFFFLGENQRENEEMFVTVRKRTMFLSYRYPRTRKDGWSEIELGGLGEYFIKGENRELNMRLDRGWRHNWMSNLIIKGFELRPKSSSK